MSLRRAILMVLAACASAPVAATATVPLPTFTAPAPAPPPVANEPLVPLPIAIPPVPPPAADATVAPIPPADTADTADTAAPAQATPAMTSGHELFARLRKNLSPSNCEAGANSARWRERYAGHPATFSRRIESVMPLLDFVSTEVERAGLPAEFTFIPLVESWYQPGAIGPGGPAGMWQMISSTARNHGIHIREGYDGRLSPVESTRAALSYLKVLQDMFGDWQAIVMAYNAGEGRMQRALRRAGSRVTSAADRRPHGLSNITYDYVAKLQALSCLVSQPQRFKLRLPVDTRYEPLVPLLLDPGMDSLDQFARARGKDTAELRRLNPGFRGGRVVAGVPRVVLAPPGASAPAAATLAIATAPPSKDLLALADEQQDAVAELLDAALAADPAELDFAAPAEPASFAPLALAALEAAPAIASAMPLPQAMSVADAAPADAPLPEHQVREGESLSSIAQQYHLSVEQIRQANKLDDKATIHPGQVLQLVP